MQILDLVFVYIIPSTLAIVCVAFMIIWLKMSPSTKTLAKTDLGISKKELAIKADPDNKLSIIALNYEAPGMLVKRRKKQVSEIYLFGIPTPSVDNDQETLVDSGMEKRILTPYTLHGKPVHCVHSATGIVCNPALLTAATWNGQTVRDNTKAVEASTALLTRDIAEKVADAGAEPVKVKGLFPWKFDAITKHFRKNWPDVLLENIELTGYTRGAKERGGSFKDYIWPLVIVGIVVIAGMVITGLATGLLGG